MHILIIAPDIPQLAGVDEEVSAVASLHKVELLHGRVVEADIRHATGRYFDIVWFITHGSSAGLMLSEGETLSIDAVVQYVRSARPGLCILNSCESVDIATAILDATDMTDVIATVSDVPDRDAVRLGVLFARELSRLNDYRQAFEASRPRYNRHYIYLRNFGRYRNEGPDPIPASSLDSGQNYLVERLIRLTDQMRSNIHEWQSSSNTQLALLKRSVDDLERQGASQAIVTAALTQDVALIKMRLGMDGQLPLGRPNNLTLVFVAAIAAMILVMGLALFVAMQGGVR